jgi:uncharacterized protein (TIGR03435 family)
MMCPRSIALIFLTVCASFGQAPPSASTFDAASVKPSKPGDSHGSTFQFTPGGGLNITNGTLRDIIETAYSVRDFQILGGPGWLNSERYDVSARSAPDSAQTGPGNSPNGVADTRLRLQTLLAQRFQLKIHRETRDVPIYALLVGKSGSKLIEGETAVSERSTAGIRAGCGQITGTLASVANLVVYLERQLRRPLWIARAFLADTIFNSNGRPIRVRAQRRSMAFPEPRSIHLMARRSLPRYKKSLG